MHQRPDIIALHDQAQAQAKQTARVVGAYYDQLRQEGVDPAAAIELALDLQRDLLFPRREIGPQEIG